MKTTFASLKRIIVSLFLIIGFALVPAISSAQEGITLSLTPPFFQLTINPAESWSSTIKVVNVNEFPLTLYASVVNFEASDESGRGKFTPLLSDDPDYRRASLAGWINVTDEPIIVSPGSSLEVPFTVTAPPDASPGGHYAAILVGTEPIDDGEDGPFISVSSLISSLIFAKVSGDVLESGDIRELSTEHIFYNAPDVPISLRFENTGNVHLLPQGEITIFNMWGKKRGSIPVNQKTEFGNVLPNSVRNFSYQWTGENSPLEAGRYTAIATLSYGSDTRKNVTKSTSFWVIPVAPVLSILGSLVFLILIITWFIKRYIRRALGAHVATINQQPVQGTKRAKVLAQPLVDGVMDLRNIELGSEKQESPNKMSIGGFVKRYKLFFYFILFLIGASILVSSYFGEVLTPEREFEVQELREVDKFDVTNTSN